MIWIRFGTINQFSQIYLWSCRLMWNLQCYISKVSNIQKWKTQMSINPYEWIFVAFGKDSKNFFSYYTLYLTFTFRKWIILKLTCVYMLICSSWCLLPFYYVMGVSLETFTTWTYNKNYFSWQHFTEKTCM